jgi:hypothetical protein
MPTPKQMEKLASAVGREPRSSSASGPGDPKPPEYWDAMLQNPMADVCPKPPGLLAQTLQLSEVPQHVLRVSCVRCDRIVEIQKADAIRLYGPKSVLKDAVQRLLGVTCRVRTGSHEDDGCWPSLE